MKVYLTVSKTSIGKGYNIEQLFLDRKSAEIHAGRLNLKVLESDSFNFLNITKEKFEDVTSSQKDVIERIESNLGIKFQGKTKHEAQIFISNHIDESRQVELEDECNSYSLPNQ